MRRCLLVAILLLFSYPAFGFDFCQDRDTEKSSAAITVTAGNTTQIVALVANTSIRVCGFWLSEATAGTVQWQQGTGTNCATSNANLTGAFAAATNGNASFGFGPELFRTNPSFALCLAAVTGNAAGVLTYVQK